MLKENLSANLRRLMKLKGLSIPELEKVSKVSRATISNILNLKADPSLSTIEKLSKGLNIDEGKLFEANPCLKSLRYRTNKNMSAREKAAKETLLFTVSEKLLLYRQLEKFSPLNVTDFSDFPSSPVEAAHKLREILNISQNVPIINFCGQLTSLGIKQFYFNFGISKTFGLSVNKDDGGPAVFVNTGTANVERWIFTLIHELGHIILHPDSYNGEIKEEDSKSQEEDDANTFAAEFLLPINVVREKVMKTTEFSFINKILEIKREFSVSYELALRQYCNAYSRNYTEILQKFRIIYKNWKKHDFKDHYEPEALPKELFHFEDTNFRNCVFLALSAEEIDFHAAAGMLETSEKELEESFNEFQNGKQSAEDFPF